MLHHDDIEVVPGDDWVINFSLVDANSSPLNITGAQLTWSFIDENGDQDAEIAGAAIINVTNAVTGLGNITIPSSATNDQNPSRCHDALRVQLASNARATVFTGTILVDANPFGGAFLSANVQLGGGGGESS